MKIPLNLGGGGADLDAITAGAGDILAGKVGLDPDGDPINGTIPSLGAQTITPSTSPQTIAAGNYLSGAQTIAGSNNLIPSCIKKGITIFGVTGTFEGYVLDPNDIYYRGETAKVGSPINLTYQYLTYDQDQITITRVSGGAPCGIPTNQLINLSGYTQLIVEGSNLDTSNKFRAYYKDSLPFSGASDGTQFGEATSDGSTATMVINLSASKYVMIQVPVYQNGAIYRIRLA